MSPVMHCNGQTKGVTTEKAQRKGTGTGTIGTLTQDHRNSGEQGLSHQPKTSWFSTLYLQSKMAFISSKKEKSRDIGKKGISSMRKHMGKVLMLQGGKKKSCVYTYILIYLFSVHFIIKISLWNRSFSQKSPEQKSLLTAKEAGGREGPGRAGTQEELLLFPAHRAAQKFTFQGRGASLSSLNPKHSCCQLQAQHLPQKWFPPLTRGWFQNHQLSKSKNGFAIGFLWCMLWVTQKPTFPHLSDICY